MALTRWAALVTAALLALAPVRAATWLQTNTAGHSAPIMRVAADAGRDAVVTVSDDKTARLWSLADGRLIATLRPPIGPARVGRLFAAALHPREDIVAVAGTGSAAAAPGPSIWLFRISNGAFVGRIDARGEHVRRLRWSSDGRLMLACYAEPGAFRAFDVESGRLVHEESFGGDCFATAVRGDRVAVGSRDGTVATFSAGPSSLTPLARFSAGGDVLSLDLSPDLRRLAIGFYTAGLGAAIVSADSGALERNLRSPFDIPQPGPAQAVSTTQAVLWSRDGRSVITAGSTDRRPRVEGRIHRFDATSGALLHGQAVAEDTITDLALAAVPPGAGDAAEAGDTVAWGSFAGTWGVFEVPARGEPRAVVRSTPQIEFLIRHGARELWISPDARTVRWARGVERSPVSFLVPERQVGPGRTAGLVDPRTRRGVFDAAQDFEDNFRPRVRGELVALRVGEVSRALSYVGNDGDVVMATSEGLRRLDRTLKTVWEVRTATDVRAVNATPDGRLLVTTMSDGTVRWWRARDGELLLSALIMPDGWVLWMPTGHFDASHGVESRIGWLVDRADSPVPDFFTVGRFRDRFHRPDVIDRVLETADAAQALQLADAARPGTAPAGNTTAIVASTSVDQILAPPDLPTPPVLAPLEPLRLNGRTGPVTLPFTLRTDRPASSLRLEARVDGLLVEPLALTLPASFDGRQPGALRLDMGSQMHVVQLVVRTGDVASEPVRYQVDRSGARPLEPATPGGTLYVVAIGIARYAEKSIRLDLPAKDAMDFVDVLKRQLGPVYADVQVRLLLDEQATRPAMEAAMRWLEERVGPQDIGALFMAGHGINDLGGSYHFVPYEFELARPSATAVPGRVFSGPLSRLRGRSLLFLDTCFAGAVTQVLGGGTQTARFANVLSAPENSVIVFASSTGKQESLERRAWGNGAFTKVLVQGLEGGARLPSVAVVTTRSLSPFVQQGVLKLTGGLQSPVAIIPDTVSERILAVPLRAP